MVSSMLWCSFILSLNFRVIYDNEFETKKNENETKDETVPQQVLNYCTISIKQEATVEPPVSGHPGDQKKVSA